MLTLDEQQWVQLKDRDALSFVNAVCDQFTATHPETVTVPGHPIVLARMQAAHDYALRAGFTSTPHIVHFLYLAADVPAIYDDLLIDTYLRKPGSTPEQRLDDLLAVMDVELRRLEQGE